MLSGWSKQVIQLKIYLVDSKIAGNQSYFWNYSFEFGHMNTRVTTGRFLNIRSGCIYESPKIIVSSQK